MKNFTNLFFDKPYLYLYLLKSRICHSIEISVRDKQFLNEHKI